MAGVISTYLRNKMLNAMLGGVTFVPSSQLWVAFYLTPPGANDLGIELDPSGTMELDGSVSNYQRFQQPNDLTAWTVAVSGLMNNANTITLATSTGTMGTVVSVGWRDAPTGGNLYLTCDLLQPVPVNIGDSLSFAPGVFTIDWL